MIRNYNKNLIKFKKILFVTFSLTFLVFTQFWLISICICTVWSVSNHRTSYKAFVSNAFIQNRFIKELRHNEFFIYVHDFT